MIKYGLISETSKLKLHQKAKELLENGETEEALAILLFTSELND